MKIPYKKEVLLQSIETSIRGKTYKPSDIRDLIDQFYGLPIVGTQKKIEYYDIPFSFDIETSSAKIPYMEKEQEKVAFLYEWSFCFYGYTIIGRTWEEFEDMLKELVEILNLSLNTRMIIYVHNLSYEFQFMRKRFKWEKVFSLHERKPIQAVTIDGIEFRCSYLLSGYSLKTLGENLKRYKVEKLIGDLDYQKIRTSNTPLTKQELQYCINDVLIVVAYIQELIERYGSIAKLPLTKTGFVRNYCRDCCLKVKKGDKPHKYKIYRNLMDGLILQKDEYVICREAFTGGFTHANPYYVKRKIPNVTSFDECSAYPYAMIAEQFPMSKPQKVNILNDVMFDDCILNYCCMFRAKFKNIKASFKIDNYISSSHCRNLKGGLFNNGRVVEAEELTITLTEQDYFIIHATYNWDECEIYDFYRFEKNYLPTDFVKGILDLYKNKTELKGVTGKEEVYLESKERLNACYGMTVTDICREDVKYDNFHLWKSEIPDIDDALSKNNKSVKRFLYYPWGVWVTAYARANLWTAILEFREDYIYSDTDSVKVINADKHSKFIENYNNTVVKKLNKAMRYHNFDIELTRPKTVKGISKQLGIWENEGTYDYFKTLGAKRYMVKENKVLDGKYDYSLTVAGLNKHKVIPYMLDLYGDNIFAHFEEELHIPAEYTGKLTHTYIDDEQEGFIEDYMGNIGYYHELSSVHLEPADYMLDITEDFLNYIFDIKEDYL